MRGAARRHTAWHGTHARSHMHMHSTCIVWRVHGVCVSGAWRVMRVVGAWHGHSRARFARGSSTRGPTRRRRHRARRLRSRRRPHSRRCRPARRWLTSWRPSPTSRTSSRGCAPPHLLTSPLTPSHTAHTLAHAFAHTHIPPHALHTPFTRRASPMATLRKPLLRIEQDLPPGEYALAACWRCWLRVGAAPAR